MIVRDAFQNSSPWMQLFFMIATVVLVFLLFFSGGLLLGGVIFSMSPADLVWVMGDVSDPGRGPVLKYFQVVQTFGLFVEPSLLLAWLYSSRPLAYLRLAPLPPARVWLWSSLAVIFLIPPANYLASLNETWSLPDAWSGVEQWMREAEDRGNQIQQLFMQDTSLAGLLGNILVVAVLGAIGEELFFRSIMQSLMVRVFRKVFPGVLLASVVFAAVHFQFFGFAPRLVMGMFLGYLLVWTGSLWAPVMAHFVNNLGGVLLGFALIRGWIPQDAEMIWSDHKLWPLWGACTLLSVFCMWQLKKNPSNHETVSV